MPYSPEDDFTAAEREEIRSALISHATYFAHLSDNADAPKSVKFFWMQHAERLLELAAKCVAPDPESE